MKKNLWIRLRMMLKVNSSSTRKMPSPPWPGLLREQGRQSSITSDMGRYGALLRSYDAASKSSSSSSSLSSDLSQQQQQCTSRQQQNYNIANLSSRLLTSVLLDLLDAVGLHHMQDTEFSEGMKTIYDALHPDVDEDAPPLHCIPYRTKNFRRLSGNLINRIHLGRAGAQPQWSLSIFSLVSQESTLWFTLGESMSYSLQCSCSSIFVPENDSSSLVWKRNTFSYHNITQ